MRRGFTLLEVLLSVLVLGLISVMIFGSFQSITASIQATEEAMESLHHGEIVLEQLVSSLRSTAFFESNPGLYTFRHESMPGNPPEDMLSWVSGTMAFLPPRYPTRQGLNRLFLSIETIEGQRGLAVSAYPHLLDPEDPAVDEVAPWLISPRVQGLQVRFYDLRTEDWVDTWEDERQLPQFLEVRLFLEPLEPQGPLRELVRMIEIPVAPLSRDVRRGRRPPQERAPAGAGPSAPPGRPTGPAPRQGPGIQVRPPPREPPPQGAPGTRPAPRLEVAP